jgi:hypothetical protein
MESVPESHNFTSKMLDVVVCELKERIVSCKK